MSRFRRNVKIFQRGVEQDSEAVSRLTRKSVGIGWKSVWRGQGAV